MPASITTRVVGYIGSNGVTLKNAPLTNEEVDTNFININLTKLDSNGSGVDLTNLNASNLASGTVAVSRGGTGQTTYTNGELLIGNTSGNTLTKTTLTQGSNIAITNGTGSITIATSLTPSFTSLTVTANTTITGDVAVNGGDLTTTATAFNLVNGTATTVNLAGAATALNLGNATASTTTLRSGTIVGSNSTQNLWNTTATIINFAGTATSLTIGATTGTTTIRNDLAVSGILSASNRLIVDSGSDQFTNSVTITPSSHVTSERAAVKIDDWLVLQDTAGNGTKDFSIYQASADVNRLAISAAGVITVGSFVSSSTQNSSLGVGIAASGTTGEIRATNNITAYFSSDKKFKENVDDIHDALVRVEAIGGKTFDWTDEYIAAHGGEDGYFVSKQDFGVIAQDVQAAFPLAVKERDDGTLAVDYPKLCALAFAAIKELSEKVRQLESK